MCHDHYLGLLPRFLANQGALIWVNPSFDNVIDVKWSSVLRLRAVENHFFALCTLHDSGMKRTRTHPFAFSPDGKELMARQVGSAVTRRLSECKKPGTIYLIDLDMSAIGKPLDWSQIPWPKKPKTRRRNPPRKPVRTKMRGNRPAIYTVSGWQNLEPGTAGRDRPRVSLRRGHSGSGDSGCGRVLSRSGRGEEKQCRSDNLEPLERTADRFVTLGATHDGQGDRMLRADLSIGPNRYS